MSWWDHDRGGVGQPPLWARQPLKTSMIHVTCSNVILCTWMQSVFLLNGGQLIWIGWPTYDAPRNKRTTSRGTQPTGWGHRAERWLANPLPFVD